MNITFIYHHENIPVYQPTCTTLVLFLSVEMVLKRLYQFDSSVPERSKVIQKLIEIFNPPMDIKIDDEKEET